MITRRMFGRLVGAAGAAIPMSEYALAQLSLVRDIPADAVRINANENPLGPCAEAMEAIRGAMSQGGRYLFEEATRLEQTLAAQEGVGAECVMAAPGSSLPLHHAVLAFTSPSRSFVAADPGYEAGDWAAQCSGAAVRRIALRKDYSHDVKAMANEANAGLIYICNPNNPTGTLTARADIEWLVENKPAGCVVMIDEAYLHISGAQACTDMVAAGKDVIVLRTFSKIYGMAGLRAGVAMAKPELLAKVKSYMMGGMPVAAMMGAVASLNAKNVVPERRKFIAGVREDVFSFFDKHGFRYVPSVSNKFMLDVGRPGREIVSAMAKEKVYIGRVWPSWPTHVRVTVGTAEEMAKFKAALLKVTA